MRWRLAIASGLMLAGAALCLFVLLPPEPSVHGRSLHSWLAVLDDGEGGRAIEWSTEPPKKLTQEQLEAASAVRQLGANAVPALFRKLQTRESAFISTKQRVRDWLTGRGFIKQSYSYESYTPAAETRHRAALGIIALEPSAKPKVSELLPLFNDTEFSKEAALVLASMGPQGLAPLETVIKSNVMSAPIGAGIPWQYVCGVWALAHFPTNGVAVIPEILAGLTNSNAGARHPCAWALTRIQIDPEIAVQALTNAACQPDLRYFCIKALANYGARAQSAVPFLLDQLHKQRTPEVVDALRAIDPDAAAEAGLKQLGRGGK